MASFWIEDEDANGDVGFGVDRSHNSAHPPPFPVVKYIEGYGHKLDSQRFSAKRLAGDVHTICDVRTGCLRDTAADGCIKSWRHCGGRGETYSSCRFSQMDSPYVRGFE